MFEHLLGPFTGWMIVEPWLLGHIGKVMPSVEDNSSAGGDGAYEHQSADEPGGSKFQQMFHDLRSIQFNLNYRILVTRWGFACKQRSSSGRVNSC